jgi:hypothetical protein
MVSKLNNFDAIFCSANFFEMQLLEGQEVALQQWLSSADGQGDSLEKNRACQVV